MKRPHHLNSIYGLMSALFLALAVIGCGQKKSENKAVPADGKELVEAKCTMCHFSDRIFKDKRSSEEWITLVQRMRAKNPAWISNEEEDALIKYLVKNVSQ